MFLLPGNLLVLKPCEQTRSRVPNLSPDGSPGDLIRLNYDVSGLIQDAINCEDVRLSQGFGDLEPGQSIADEPSIRGGQPHSGPSNGQCGVRVTGCCSLFETFRFI